MSDKIEIVLPGGAVIRGEDCRVVEKDGRVKVSVPLPILFEALCQFFGESAEKMKELGLED